MEKQEHQGLHESMNWVSKVSQGSECWKLTDRGENITQCGSFYKAHADLFCSEKYTCKKMTNLWGEKKNQI